MTPRGAAELTLERGGEETLVLRLAGSWTLDTPLPAPEEILGREESTSPLQRIDFNGAGIERWDSALLTFLLRLHEGFSARQVDIRTAGLPEGVQRLLALATAVPERKGARREKKRASFLSRMGSGALALRSSSRESLAFLGEAALSFGRLLTGKARFQRSDLFLYLQESGAQALPIVSLISLLVGLILAFVGAVQLRLFGAEIYVADLVGLGMAREMGAMMTGIIMAGRTGAAYAAQLGTMQVNEEVDALQTLGVSPMDFLVLPRLLALAVMLPLLTLYSDLMGILGGAVVGVGLMDISPTQYLLRTREAVPLRHFGVGLFKGTVYGVIVAFFGCLRGMQCGRSASAVGEATTSAVVSAIIWIIVSCAVLTVVFDRLGI